MYIKSSSSLAANYTTEFWSKFFFIHYGKYSQLSYFVFRAILMKNIV